MADSSEIRRVDNQMRTIFCLAAVLVCEFATAAESQPVAERRHESKPLSVREFQGERGEAPERFLAYTETALRYKIHFSHQSNGRTVSAWLTSAEIYAVFLPADSWWDEARDNRKLLDHEQGHFDITEVLALEFQLEINKLLARSKALQVTAKDAEQATAALQAKFGTLQKDYERRLKQEQECYDDTTRYGTKPTQQAAERRRQLETLRRLTKEMAELTKGR